ncbi:MAG TPA: hypothetical protein VGG06_20030 [Thermoanaerobaculia bacterium]|jgi:hypothetical protein
MDDPKRADARRTDPRRTDPRRDLCEELAATLATDDGLRAARLLHLAAAPAAAAPAAAAEDAVPEDGPRPISIWRPREEGGELVFARPEPLPLGDHYAARREIRARKGAGTRRVVLLGESVVAGYLYAPRLTPAAILETQLAAAGRYEVVDLARTNETLAGLAATASASLQLAPDALVIFAGNNWNLLETPQVSPFVPSVEARQRYAQALADGGAAGPARLAARELARKAAGTLAAVARTAGAAGAAVIVVVPEVNLADWESRQPVPWLPGDASARWHELYGEAVDALGRRDWPAAAGRAEAMRHLAGDANGTAARVLARAELGRGRPAAAREAAREEVDLTSYATLAFLDAPRATSQAQDLLRRAAARHGWALVDLPRLFAAGSDLPGRRLFLDYCHLTSEAARVAMAAVARALVERLETRELTADAFLDVAVNVPAEVEATACFGAALHGAHRLLTVGGERPILAHWCREALAASPGVGAAMLDVIEARSSPGPALLTAAQERNYRSPYRLSLQHGWRWDFVDADLVETICDVLEAAGRPARAEARRLFADHLAVTARGVELVDPPYLWEPLERFYPEVMATADLDGRATLRAPWPSSSFCLVHEGRGEVALELTARLPAIDGFDGSRTGEARVRVNGREAGRCRLGEGWTSQRLRVPGCRRGLNRVTVEWPPLPPAGDAALEQAIRRLEIGREAEIHPVFGEIHSLRASTCAPNGIQR